MKIYCTGCKSDVEARLIDGAEAYPYREDLASLPFWKCDTCKNFVGCHHKTKNRTKPLGNIPTKELKVARQYIHKILDPLWQSGTYTRGQLYNRISDFMGFKYHTAELANLEDARKVYKYILELKKG